MNESQQEEIDSLRQHLEQLQSNLSSQKESYESSLKSLEKDLETTKVDSSKQVTELSKVVERLEKENQALKKPKSAFEEDDNEDLMARVESLERERRMVDDDYQRRISKLEHSHKLALTELQEELDARENELRKLRRERSTAEVTEDPHINDMKAEIRKLKNDLLQASRMRDEEEFSLDRKSMEKEISSLKLKLEERESRIASLTSTSNIWNRQIVSQKNELESLRTINSAAEVTRLKRELEAKAKVEETLTGQFQQLRKQAQSTHEELAHLHAMLEQITSEKNRLERSLDEACVNPDKVAAEHTRRQLQERDDAIANLVKQSIALEKTIRELQDELSFTKKQLVLMEENRPSSFSLPEVSQLRREAEVFAGQVIELDQEIDSLKKSLESKDGEIADLKKVIQKLESTSGVRSAAFSSRDTMDLKAELDELKEANEVQLEEIRVLRRRAREFETQADQVSKAQHEASTIRFEAKQLKDSVATLSKEKDDVLHELNTLKKKYEQDLACMERELHAAKTQQSRSIAELEDELMIRDKALAQQKTGNIDEMELQGLHEELSTLRRNFASQSASLESANSTIKELESMIANKSSVETVRYEEEREELLAEIESLHEQLESAQLELKRVEDQRFIIDDFKAKLEGADEAREASEKSIIDTYERKLSLLKLDKDVTIDKLRSELMVEKEGNTAELKEFEEKIKEYENEISELKEELKTQVEERESRIFSLESTLEAQEQLLKNMRIEMDHLQSSMDVTAETRRKHADDMQQDLLDVTSKNAKLEREIDSLKAQIEADRLKYESEVTSLQDKISSLESASFESHQDDTDAKMEARLHAVKERLEKLSWRNTSLKEENMELRERLFKAEEISNQCALQDQEEIAALQARIEEQSLRIQELETISAKSRTPSRPRAMFSPPPAHPQSTNRSAERRPSNRLGGILSLGKRSSSVPRGTTNEI
jgi:chromosome segregation ATPase